MSGQDLREFDADHMPPSTLGDLKRISTFETAYAKHHPPIRSPSLQTPHPRSVEGPPWLAAGRIVCREVREGGVQLGEFGDRRPRIEVGEAAVRTTTYREGLRKPQEAGLLWLGNPIQDTAQITRNDLWHFLLPFRWTETRSCSYPTSGTDPGRPRPPSRERRT